MFNVEIKDEYRRQKTGDGVAKKENKSTVKANNPLQSFHRKDTVLRERAGEQEEKAKKKANRVSVPF